MQFDSRETIIIAILVLFLGRFINKKINILSFYNIPEPVTGGIIASLVFSLFYFLSDISFSFSLDQRDSLLVVFFTCIGLSSCFNIGYAQTAISIVNKINTLMMILFHNFLSISAHSLICLIIL